MKARTSMNGLLLIFFFIVQASEQLQVPLSSVYPLGYYFVHSRSAEIQAAILTIFLSQWDTRCCGHKLLFSYSPYLSPELQGEQAGRCTLLISETSLVPCVCWGKAGEWCRKAVQISSQPTRSHCFRSGVIFSGIFRWKRVIKKGPVLPENTGGKTEGQMERSHQLSIDRVYTDQGLRIYSVQNEVSSCGQALLDGLQAINIENRKVNLKFHSAKKCDFWYSSSHIFSLSFTEGKALQENPCNIS